MTEELRPAVFFDRDGTIIEDVGYLADPGGVAFYPGVPEAMKSLQERGYALVVVTNQSGVGRGYFDEATAIRVNLSMTGMLEREGVKLTAVYYCPHHPDDRCSCRKPETLMIRRAISDLDIDPDRSWVVGDVDKDVLAGLRAGMRSILVKTGKSDKGIIPDGVLRCGNAVEAVHRIMDEEER